MTARVDYDAVIEVFDTDLAEDTVDRFILSANRLVERQLVASGKPYTETDLTEIELYLACHFCCLIDPRTKSESLEGISASFEGGSGNGLESSRYGQMAISLDPYGMLKKAGNQKEFLFEAVPS